MGHLFYILSNKLHSSILFRLQSYDESIKDFLDKVMELN